MTEIDVLKDIATRLSGCGIDYMISGSVAMNFYSIPRMTRDIDIVISINHEDIDKIFNLFKNDYYIDKNMIIEAVKNLSMFNIIHLKEIIKIDFIIRKNEEYRILEFKNKKKVLIDNMEINIVSLEDLIISKISWAKESSSEIQINDIKNLINNQFDIEYVKKWCNNLGLTFLLEKIFNEK